MSAQSSTTRWSNPRRRGFLAGVVVLLVVGLGFAAVRLYPWFASRPNDASSSPLSTDPRLAYDGPYRNIHPDVRYVGDAQCISCHADIAQSYSHHPMGRSLVPVQSLIDQQRYTPDTNNPFTALGRRFEVTRQGDRMWHREAVVDDAGKPIVELPLEARWVVGSGAKGYSYLFERDGYLFQTPISWYTHQHRWDLSPGFGGPFLTGRLVGTSCLFCHANRVHEHPQQPNRFLPPLFDGLAIGCERCHGPGERHIESTDRWDIVNPARLTPQLRDAVCEQCHLEGEGRIVRAGRQLFDYRPGLPLHEFLAVIVEGRHDGEATKAVNHVEQMYQSKCFSKAVDGVKLGCITCHDPHVHIGPSQRQTYYRAKCLICHNGEKEASVCSVPLLQRKQVSAEDNCIDCHMPSYRSWNVAHTATTDHRVIRGSMRLPKDSHDAAPPPRPNLDNVALVDFYRDRFPGGDPQIERSLGLALLKLMRMNMLQQQRHADRALRLLELALGRDPSDGAVRQGKVEAYLLLNRAAEALSEAEVLVPEQPGNSELVVLAAYAAQGSGQLDQARDYLRHAVELNPFIADDQVHLMGLLIRAGQIDEARKCCEQLLRLDPFNLAGWQARVGFLLQQKQRDEAQRAFEIIRRLKPPDLGQREELFKQQLQSEPPP